ncbi:sodium/substrate symporter small subunit [uncultured Xylophilus sp.]|uniref:DUF4212 domain-containing protein n=1 Tax=uncultured Xylophilus sp. TaxID=296832 RepID=UPI0025E08640|nr:sodium/substrate symporter small subunit [uncultured Xylophilus sp.]
MPFSVPPPLPPADPAPAPMREIPVPRHGLLRGALLIVWAAASFGACYVARMLDVVVGGWHVGYWMAAQGILIVFMLVVVVYAVAANRAERRDTTPDAVPRA